MNESSAPRYIPIKRDQRVLQPLDIEQIIPAEHGRSLAVAGEGRARRDTFSSQLLISDLDLYLLERHALGREIERQMARKPALEWLAGLRTVNHHTLSDFRVAHAEALLAPFTQVLAMLTVKKLITLGTGRDRRHQNPRCREQEKFLAHPKDPPPSQAGARARRRARTARSRTADDQATTGRSAPGRPRRKTKARGSGGRDPTFAGREETRQEERIAIFDGGSGRFTFMRTSDGGVAAAYNVQATADAGQGLIADIEVIADPQDAEQLPPTVERLKEAFGRSRVQLVTVGDHVVVVNTERPDTSLAIRKSDIAGAELEGGAVAITTKVPISGVNRFVFQLDNPAKVAALVA